MCKGGAPGGTWQAGGAAHRRRKRSAQQPDAFADVGDGAGDDEQRQTDAERPQQWLAFQHEGRRQSDEGNQEGTRETLGDAKEGAALPVEQPTGSPRHQASSGQNGTTTRRAATSGPKVALKNGAPTEISSPVIASSTSG